MINQKYYINYAYWKKAIPNGVYIFESTPLLCKIAAVDNEVNANASPTTPIIKMVTDFLFVYSSLSRRRKSITSLIIHIVSYY